MVMLRFNEADHALVTAAVADAERKSDGEIVTIVAERSDSYHDAALHYAVAAMLLVPALIAFLPQGTVDGISAMLLGWDAELTRFSLMTWIATFQIGLFLLVRYGLAWMPLRMALTPARAKTRRVRRRAIALFKASAEHRTLGRTGILLYVSLREHRAEIVADQAIHSKVAPEIWGEAMAVLVDNLKAGRPGEGVAKAVEAIGAVLAQHLPKTVEDTNELPDRLIEL
ncbi:TPM domain-containing protein [Allosphingosinicella vermicomposti]|uniref:TPM domain-containing protein n=1 Tax=Allosphingosinicella vermicomposti TaxID=614671 RepID=UPI000D0FA6CA|nr:hypothetical protein [Allosphingosinicella vermicomposti]